jgi:hypothetical protein
MPSIVIVSFVCVLGIALSLKSIAVLGGAAPWTSAGWWLTILYFIAVIAKTAVAPALPPSIEYSVLAALALAFVVAGVRDERQAEPWWWPNRRGTTRAEKGRSTV